MWGYCETNRLDSIRDAPAVLLLQYRQPMPIWPNLNAFFLPFLGAARAKPSVSKCIYIVNHSRH